MKNLFDIESYNYSLDEELIAKMPISPRHNSRVMVIDRSRETIEEMPFYDIVDLFQNDDTFIFNDTKVIPARLIGTREHGGIAEIFLVKPTDKNVWEVLAKPGKKLKPGSIVTFGDNFLCKILEDTPMGTKFAEFLFEGDFEALLNKYGKLPIPHYMEREATLSDQKNYQTIFAKNPGAAAAPTAGLHFTNEVLEKMRAKSITQEKITLHVGLGTFSPMRVTNLLDHNMHSERGFIASETADRLNQNINSLKKQVCVGTTCCRLLESAASIDGKITSGSYDTNIFLYPGYQFKFVKTLLTNFHLPKSTLLMLVCAFGGYELIMEAYKKAVYEKYRFFSYGDAMLIL